MNADRDHTRTDADPASTWGATEEAKRAWERKHGRAAAKKNEQDADKENDK